jgi:hypothetical protein
LSKENIHMIMPSIVNHHMYFLPKRKGCAKLAYNLQKADVSLMKTVLRHKFKTFSLFYFCPQVRSGRTWEVHWAQLSHPAKWRFCSLLWQRLVSSWQHTWRTVSENNRLQLNMKQLVEICILCATPALGFTRHAFYRILNHSQHSTC